MMSPFRSSLQASSLNRRPSSLSDECTTSVPQSISVTQISPEGASTRFISANALHGSGMWRSTCVARMRSKLPTWNGSSSALPTRNERFSRFSAERWTASAIIVSLESRPTAFPGETIGANRRRKSPVPQPTSSTLRPGRRASGAKKSLGEMRARSRRRARVASRRFTKNRGSSV